MLDQLGNIMTTIALGLAVMVVAFFAVAFADHWLEGKAGKRFLSFGVVASMAVASVFWWGGWWWQSAAAQSGQNENYGYGLVAVSGAIALGIIWRNFAGGKWPYAILGTALQVAIAWHFSMALALFVVVLLMGGSLPAIGGGSRPIPETRHVYINRTDYSGPA